ncbi:MAG: hypothetical protein ACAH80_05035 [Alphaproteobacteria bacterium]
MAYAREVKETFEKILDDNNAAIRDLEGAINQTQSDKASLETSYATSINRFATSLFTPKLNEATLDKLSWITDGKTNFVQEYRAQVEDSRLSEIKLNALTATHGEFDVLDDRLKGLRKEVKAAIAHERDLSETANVSALRLRQVDRFNAEAPAGAAKLEEASIGYFNSKTGVNHLINWMFNGHYRRGRALIKSFAEDGATIPAVQKQLVDERAAVATAVEATKAVVARKDEVEKPHLEMQQLAEKVKSNDDIAEGLTHKLTDLLDDRAFFCRAVASLGQEFPQAPIEMRSKIEGMGKLVQSTRNTVTSLRQSGAKLEKNLPKLRKAASKNSRKNINVDLPKIKKGFKAQQTMAKHKAAEVRKASTSMKDYSGSSSGGPIYSAPDPLDFYMGFMIADMLTHHHHHADVASSAASAVSSAPDPAVLNEAIGIPDNVAADAGLDLDNLSPSLSDAEMGDLSGAFNDAGSLDVGDIGNVDVPDVDVPDFEMPDLGDIGDVFGGFDF